jgi:PqqA peptide cyclase
MELSLPDMPFGMGGRCACRRAALALDATECELDTATWLRVFHEAAGPGVLQVHLSGGEARAARSRGHHRRTARGRSLHQSHHLGGRDHKRDAGRIGASRTRPCTDIDPRQRRRLRRSHRRLRGRICQEAGARGRGRAAKASTHGERGRTPCQHRQDTRLSRSGACARCEPHRDCARAILWLGAQEPRRADAVAGSGRARGGGGAACASPRAHRNRRRGAGLLRASSEAVRGRRGRRSLNVTPAGKLLPCHAAESIPGLQFWNVRERLLADIWRIPRPSTPSGTAHG